MNHLKKTIALISFSALFSQEVLCNNVPLSRLSHTQTISAVLKMETSFLQKIKDILIFKGGLCHGCSQAILITRPKDIVTFIKSDDFIRLALFYQKEEKIRAKHSLSPKNSIIKVIRNNFKEHLIHISKNQKKGMILRLIRKSFFSEKSHSIYVDFSQMRFYCAENGLFIWASLDDFISILMKRYLFHTIVCEIYFHA